jgi:uncharacterized MAPEG superfamily protein
VNALDDPGLRVLALCFLVLAAKLVALATATSVLRMRARAFDSPEDYRVIGLEPPAGGGEPDPRVERVRRAHRNAVENTLPFLGVGLLYALAGPPLLAVQIGCIGFTAARVLHTIVYLCGLQPWRSICYAIAMGLLLWMGIEAAWRWS